MRRSSKGFDSEKTNLYLDDPRLLEGDEDMALFQGRLHITDSDSHLERQVQYPQHVQSTP